MLLSLCVSKCCGFSRVSWEDPCLEDGCPPYNVRLGVSGKGRAHKRGRRAGRLLPASGIRWGCGIRSGLVPRFARGSDTTRGASSTSAAGQLHRGRGRRLHRASAGCSGSRRSVQGRLLSLLLLSPRISPSCLPGEELVKRAEGEWHILSSFVVVVVVLSLFCA